MKVVVVGNSACNLNKKNGQLIDDFDIVIRLNKFKILGYEKYVGSKCDIYCSKWLNMSYNINILNQFKNIWLPYPKPPNWWTSDGNFKEVSEQEHKKYIKKYNLNENIISYLPIECLNEFESIFKKVCQPSTGLIAISMAINLFKNCTIKYTGFDAFSTGWYWDPNYNCLKNMKNSILFEKIYMNKIKEKYGVESL